MEDDNNITFVVANRTKIQIQRRFKPRNYLSVARLFMKSW